MRYLWTEDTGAGFHFWKLVNRLFFDDELVIESKGSNQGLLDAVSDLDIKEDDKCYVAFDYVVDNQDSVNCFSEKCKQTSPLISSRVSTQFIILHLSLYFYTFSFLCSTRYAYAIVPPALIIDLIHENCFFSNPGIAFLNTSSFLLLFLFCTSCIN